MNLTIRKLNEPDALVISQAFAKIGWDKPATQYVHYHQQQQNDQCIVLVAEWQSKFAGYLKINWQSEYIYFMEEDIPEIQDLNVLPQFRRCGIAGRLMDKAETIAAKRSDIVGISVGLHEGYNAAQRMYVLRGYVPDGKGVTWKGRYIQEGQEIIADDDLVLHLIKEVGRDS